MAKQNGIIAAVLGIILTCLKLWHSHKKTQAAADTPDKRAENDCKKVNDAIVNDDSNVINDMFNKL